MSEALLLIDLQRGFCAADGSVAAQGWDVAPLAAVVGVCRDLARAARLRGIPVLWTRIGWAADYADGGLLTNVLRPNLARSGALQRGSSDWEIVPEAGYRTGETVIDKTRFSALVGTTLEQVLRELAIDRIAVGGVTTSMCVESTVRDLGQRDIVVNVVADACADFTLDRHNTALAAMAFGFARCAVARDVISAWSVSPCSLPTSK